MTTEKIKEEIKLALIHSDSKAFESILSKLVKLCTPEESGEIICITFEEQYTRFKADYLAKYLEIVLRTQPNLAQVNHPNNSIFKLVFITGSIDLYECYLEEGLNKFVANLAQDDRENYFLGLYGIADYMSKGFINEYNECIKGMDYNGAIRSDDITSNLLLINKEDYEIMDDVMQRYNTIIGRKNIIKDLEIKAGIE